MKKNLSHHWRNSSPRRTTIKVKNGVNSDAKYPADFTLRQNSLQSSFDGDDEDLYLSEELKVTRILRNMGYALTISIGKQTTLNILFKIDCNYNWRL